MWLVNDLVKLFANLQIVISNWYVMNKFIFTSIFTFFFCANVGQDFNRPHVFPAIPEAINIGTVVPVSINADPMRYTPGTGNVYSRFQTSKSAALASIVNTDPMRYTPGTGKVYECFMNKNRTKEVASVGNICAEVVSVPCSCVDGVAKPEVTEVTAVVVQSADKAVTCVAQSYEGNTSEYNKQKEEIEEFLSERNLGRKTDVITFEGIYVHLVRTLHYDQNLVKEVMVDSQPKYGFIIGILNDAFKNVEARSK